jgi:poly(A) polymerase
VSGEGAREAAIAVVERLRGAGHEAWLVGGCVREMVLGREPKDYDVTTAALPQQVIALFPRVVEVGRQFGVVTVIERGVPTEVATFRTEGSYTDGRRPDEVTFASAKEDVARRDFTINALLYDPTTDELVDHVGGLEDLRQRVLRTVGDARERFREDRLRMLRAVRFAARLDLKIDPDTAEAARELAHLVPGSVSPERIREELSRMLHDPSRAAAFRLLDELALLREVLPELEACRGVAQPAQYHPEGDVLTHVLLAMEKLPPETTEAAAWGVLLHDIGKPATFTDGPDRIRFHRHETVGADMADALAERLRFSNALRERVVLLVRKHLVPRDAPNMRTSKLRRFIAEEWLDDLLAVARADAEAGSGVTSHLDYILEKRAELGALPPPLLTGDDLRALGIPPGPVYGRILATIRDEQLEGRITTKDEALARARDLVESSPGSA